MPHDDRTPEKVCAILLEAPYVRNNIKGKSRYTELLNRLGHIEIGGEIRLTTYWLHS